MSAVRVDPRGHGPEKIVRSGPNTTGISTLRFVQAGSAADHTGHSKQPGRTPGATSRYVDSAPLNKGGRIEVSNVARVRSRRS